MVAETNDINIVLSRLKDQTEKLQSYQCRIEYLFRQPLFESKTLKKGVLYYAKLDDKSALRINFETLKQDDESEQKYKEQYIFDGVWLTHIDYQIKQIRRYQQTEPNTPLDAFELAKRNFPIIGFGRIEDLEKDFQISLVRPQQKQQDFIQLHLSVKPDSVYKDDYTSMDFWIGKKSNLPTKVIAVSTEEDLYQITMSEPRTNQQMKKSVFEFDLPKDFTMEVVGLDKAEDK
jgi:outer membrane lipoprotein-sorting protein